MLILPELPVTHPPLLHGPAILEYGSLAGPGMGEGLLGVCELAVDELEGGGQLLVLLEQPLPAVLQLIVAGCAGGQLLLQPGQLLLQPAQLLPELRLAAVLLEEVVLCGLVVLLVAGQPLPQLLGLPLQGLEAGQAALQ
jgi:hypothetical protein